MIHLREAHFGEILKPYREIQPEQLILRDRLARDRTLLAYIRTGIMLFASGLSIIKLLPGDPFFPHSRLFAAAAKFTRSNLGL